MEFASRIHIKVSNPSAWEKLYKLDTQSYDFSVPARVMFNISGTDYIIDGDYSTTPEELEDFVSAIADYLEADGIIIADNTCLSVDPYTFVAMYFGDEVRTEYFEIDYDDFSPGDKMCDLFEKADIKRIPEYLRYGSHFRFNEKEKDVLAKCGIDA